MRGDEKQQGGMFSYVTMEERVPPDHPLRAIRRLVDQILARMSKRFDKMYAENGRPSIPPERLLRALLLPTFYSIRSERMLMEQLDYNLLFRWFVGLEMDEPVWNHAVFSKNRERLLNESVAREFFAEVIEQAKPHLSQEHFTVDGTMIEAWASQKSFQRIWIGSMALALRAGRKPAPRATITRIASAMAGVDTSFDLTPKSWDATYRLRR